MNNSSIPERVLFSQIPHERVLAYLPVVGPLGWAVYQFLLAYRNHGTSTAYPAIKTIAEGTGTSPATVKREIDCLTGKDGTLAANGLAPLLTKAERMPTSEQKRKRGGRPVNEYGFPIYERDRKRIQQYVAWQKRERENRSPPQN